MAPLLFGLSDTHFCVVQRKPHDQLTFVYTGGTPCSTPVNQATTPSILIWWKPMVIHFPPLLFLLVQAVKSSWLPTWNWWRACCSEGREAIPTHAPSLFNELVLGNRCGQVHCTILPQIIRSLKRYTLAFKQIPTNPVVPRTPAQGHAWRINAPRFKPRCIWHYLPVRIIHGSHAFHDGVHLGPSKSLSDQVADSCSCDHEGLLACLRWDWTPLGMGVLHPRSLYQHWRTSRPIGLPSPHQQ